MKYYKIIATLLGIGIASFSICQTKPKTQDNSYLKELAEKERLDSERRIENSRNMLKEKEISIEIPVTQLTNITVENNNRPIEIKTWSQPKVKISAIAIYQGSDIYIKPLDGMNVQTKLQGNSLKINTFAINNTTNKNSQNAAIGENNWTYENETNSNKTVTIYIPIENKLSIESKYSDVVVANDLKKISIDITGGSLELQNSNHLTLHSKYANVTINEIQNGDIDFINGKLSIQSLGEVELDTKYSTVEIGSAKKLTFKSTNDEYELENVTLLEGSKNYGTLRISKLTESIQLDGINADVKIKNISSQAKSIWIDNKYADLRVPLKNIKNFSLTYDGVYSTIYKNFAAILYESNNNTGLEASDTRITTGDSTNSKFKAKEGVEETTKIAIKCQNCTVDFR